MKILAISELTCHTVWVSCRSGGCTSTRRCQWKGGATYQASYWYICAGDLHCSHTHTSDIAYNVDTCFSRTMTCNSLQFHTFPYYCKLMQDSMHLQSTPGGTSLILSFYLYTFCIPDTCLAATWQDLARSEVFRCRFRLAPVFIALAANQPIPFVSWELQRMCGKSSRLTGRCCWEMHWNGMSSVSSVFWSRTFRRRWKSMPCRVWNSIQKRNCRTTGLNSSLPVSAAFGSL